jgi:hypothetical protein
VIAAGDRGGRWSGLAALALGCAMAAPIAAQPPAMAHGESIELELAHAPFSRADAPEAVAHLPAGLDATRPVALVLMLHGYSGCARVLVSDAADARCRPRDAPEQGYGWAAAHDAAGTNSILLVPQLAWRVRDGSPGRLQVAGEAARLVDEALAALAPQLGRTLTTTDLASVTVAAHSAGFESTLAVVRHGGLEARLRHVVLFDALYAGGPVFLDWLAGASDASPRTLVSLVTHGRTLERTTELTRAARRRWPDATLQPDALPTALPAPAPRLVAAVQTSTPHRDVPSALLAATLRALGLPHRP